MKKLIPIFSLLFLFSCQSADKNQSTASANGEPTILPMPEKSPVPLQSDVPDILKDYIRKTLRTELDFTLPALQGYEQAKKSYSFDLGEDSGRPMWVIKEKYHDLEGKLYAGAEYRMLSEVINPNEVHAIRSADGTKVGIRIRPTENNSFLYHPYSNEPDTRVPEVVIGWFDKGQEAALMRAVAYMQMLVKKWGMTPSSFNIF